MQSLSAIEISFRGSKKIGDDCSYAFGRGPVKCRLRRSIVAPADLACQFFRTARKVDFLQLAAEPNDSDRASDEHRRPPSRGRQPIGGRLVASAFNIAADATADERAGVDVDDRQRLGVVDHQVAAAREVHAARSGPR